MLHHSIVLIHSNVAITIYDTFQSIFLFQHWICFDTMINLPYANLLIFNLNHRDYRPSVRWLRSDLWPASWMSLLNLLCRTFSAKMPLWERALLFDWWVPLRAHLIALYFPYDAIAVFPNCMKILSWAQFVAHHITRRQVTIIPNCPGIDK